MFARKLEFDLRTWLVRIGIVAMAVAVIYGHFSFKEVVFLVTLGAIWIVLITILETVTEIGDKLLKMLPPKE